MLSNERGGGGMAEQRGEKPPGKSPKVCYMEATVQWGGGVDGDSISSAINDNDSDNVDQDDDEFGNGDGDEENNN